MHLITPRRALLLSIAAVLLMGAVILAANPFTSQAQTRTPQPPEPVITGAATQRFYHGWIIWRQDLNTLMVLYDDTGYGCGGSAWEIYPDNWHDGLPEYDEAIEAETGPGRLQPRRGIGYLWRTVPHVRQRLDWALEPEEGYTMLYYQYQDRIWLNGAGHNVFVIQGNQWRLVNAWAPDERCRSLEGTPLDPNLQR